MYLEMIFDAGVLGLLVTMIFYAVIMKRSHKSLSSIKDPTLLEYQAGALIGMLNYFMSGFTGGSFFPNLENSYFLILLAVSLIIMKLTTNQEKNTDAQQA